MVVERIGRRTAALFRLDCRGEESVTAVNATTETAK